jgi:hypothetical protein
MSAHSTVKETHRLGSKHDGWNLPGSTNTGSRTRNAGSGRPNLAIKKCPGDSSTTDSDYEEEESDESSPDEEESESSDDEEVKKPEPTRLFIEYASLKKCMEKKVLSMSVLRWSGRNESQDPLSRIQCNALLY